MAQDFERIRIQIDREIFTLLSLVRILAREQILIEPHFRIDRMRGGEPVDGGLHFPAVGRVTAARSRVIRAVNLRDVARVRILHHTRTGDEVAVAQTHFLAGREPVILLWRYLAEIVLLDVEYPREGHFAG